MKKLLTVLFVLIPLFVFAQVETPKDKSVLALPGIYAPEGLNLPGDWNGWVNPPAENSALGSQFQVTGGKVTKIIVGTYRWTTTIKAAASGGDVIGGTYEFLFTSGPSGSPWSNKWAGTNVSMNTIQSYSFNTGANNSITVINDKWYTMNWKDNAYANNEAIFMETSGEPVNISTVSVPGSSPAQGVTVPITITLSSAKSPEEKVYIRYTNDGWTSSDAVLATVTGTSGSAEIPAQIEGTVVSYYALTTTVSAPWSDADMVTIKSNTNGGSNYSYTVGPPTSGTVNDVTYTDPTSLTGNLTVTGTLSVNATVNTGSNTIDLGTGGQLSETLTNYVIGNVSANPSLNGGSPVDINGLGITINPNGNNLGATTVIRRTGTAVMGVGLNRQWTITPATPPGSSVNVTLTWPAGDDNGLNLSNLYIYRSEDNGATWIVHAGPLSTASNPRSLSFTTTTFSDWTIGDGDSPLPIELLTWSATAGDKKVTLNWETASELNHAGFEIYRSAREKSDFRLVASYTSSPELRGKGELGGKYSLVDRQVLNTVTYYYKLVDVALDGKRTEHKVLSVIPTDGKSVQPGFEFPIEFGISSLYPNPFNPSTNLVFDLPKDGLVSIRLYNVIGQEVKVIANEIMKKGRDHVQTITADEMPTGVYMVVVEFGGQRLTKKLTFLK